VQPGLAVSAARLGQINAPLDLRRQLERAALGQAEQDPQFLLGRTGEVEHFAWRRWRLDSYGAEARMYIWRRGDRSLELLVRRGLTARQRFVAHAGQHDIERHQTGRMRSLDAMSGAQFALDREFVLAARFTS
jgi:hypothetical protein